MPLSMHAAIPASSVYVKSRTAYCPDLSSAPAADFIDAAEFLDAADLTSAAEFPTVPLCHPSTVSSSLEHSSPKPQLSSAYCLASCCVLPHTHSADFRYCHAGCHPVATVQQCFSSAYALTDFNPVTNLPHQKNPTPSSDRFEVPLHRICSSSQSMFLRTKPLSFSHIQQQIPSESLSTCFKKPSCDTFCFGSLVFHKCQTHHTRKHVFAKFRCHA